MSSRTFSIGVFLFTATLLALLFSSLASAQTGTPCNLYQSGQTSPAGYGAAWNVFDSSGQALLLDSRCAGNAATLSIGIGLENHYVYKQGYTYTNNAWHPCIFSGNFVQGSTD